MRLFDTGASGRRNLVEVMEGSGANPLAKIVQGLAEPLWEHHMHRLLRRIGPSGIKTIHV